MVLGSGKKKWEKVTSTKEITKMIKKTDTEYLLGVTEINIKATIRMT